MDVDEFYAIAEFLFNHPPAGAERGAYRSAISRYYYFIFLNLRDNIIKHDGRSEIEELLASPTSYSAHTALRVYLQELGRNANRDQNIRSTVGVNDIRKVTFKIAQKLSDLHEKRKFADYETQKDIDMHSLRKLVQDSKILVDEIKNQKNNIVALLNMLKTSSSRLPDPEQIKSKIKRR